jgi:hypothetical protein
MAVTDEQFIIFYDATNLIVNFLDGGVGVDDPYTARHGPHHVTILLV